MFFWPSDIKINDLKHVGDLYDFHLALPYDSWGRNACTDAMGCKIGQKLFVRCLQVFLIENKLIQYRGDKGKLKKNLKDQIESKETI